MVPATSRASAAAKPVTRKRFNQRQSAENASDEELDLYNQDTTPTRGEQIADLQSIAERVGKEVDIFAETLDRFNSQLHTKGSQRQAALRLCTQYRDHAIDEVKRIKKRDQMQRVRNGHSSFTNQASPSLFSTRAAGAQRAAPENQGEKASYNWQAEAETWELLRVLLGVRLPSAEEKDDQQARLNELGPAHKYSSHHDNWQRFILTDDAAREKHVVVRWLEQAAHGRHADDTPQSKTGSWSNGWMETRERIKGAKRMRLSKDEQLDIETSDGRARLASELDPDAPMRQESALEAGDDQLQRQMWREVYQMLRGGSDYQDIVKWCTERNQGWMAVSLGVAGVEQTPAGISGPALGALWRRMCLVQAKSDNSDSFQAAAFGILSGDLASVLKVARTWDDKVFAHFHHSLVSSYEAFVLRLTTLQLPNEFVRQYGLAGGDVAQTSLAAGELIQQLRRDAQTAMEALSPFKLIQGSLIANTFPELCIHLGKAIAEAAWKEGPSEVIKPVQRTTNVPASESVIRDDPDSLRIAAHILLVLRSLQPESYTADGAAEYDNIIAGYIQLLRAAANRDMTPLYASLMAPSRCVASLASIIADDQDANDSMALLKIIGVYKIDTIAVIKGQYEYQLERVLSKSTKEEKVLSLLQSTSDELYPGQRVVLEGASRDLTADEESLVAGMGIFFLLEGQWTFSFDALATTCGQLLGQGHFAAARALCEHVQFEQLSLSKSSALLSKSIDVMDPQHIAMIVETTDKAHDLHFMQREARPFFDMTLLIRAVNALEKWRKVEHEYASKTPKPSSVPARVRKGLEEVLAAIEPILSGIFVEFRDDDEAALFAKIRTNYLPEIILSYITVLSTAGHMISREELLTAMDLANIVANNEQNGLRQAFIESGRMTELVTMFAEVSKIMLKLNEVGPARRARKEKGGRSLGIWEIYG